MPPKSMRSRRSIDSSGIPVGKTRSDTAKLMREKYICKDMFDKPKLRPEGVAEMDEKVYDCIVFFIYCPKHDNVAVQLFSGSCTWLPFILMPRNTPWRKATIDGVMMLIGRQDSELDINEAEKVTPEFRISCLHHFRVQIATKRLHTRLTQFIHLINNGIFECCRNNDMVTWISSDKIIKKQITNVWGPELKILSSMLLLNRPSIIAEFTLQNATYYYTLKDSLEEKLLKSFNLTEQNIVEIYTDYLEHCYPSFYMCFQSYKTYLENIGFPENDERFYQLFSATAVFHKWYIDFHEFLIGISVLEPELSNLSPLRETFLFTFYDDNNKGFLSRNDVESIIKDSNHSISAKGIQVQINRISKKINDINRLFPKDFGQLLRDPSFDWTMICRSPKSIIKLLIEFVTKKRDDTTKSLNYEQVLKASRPGNENGTCENCKPPQYRYGNHSVTIDTLGRCVESTIVSHMWQKPEAISKPDSSGKSNNKNKRMDVSKYSIEVIFSNSSIPNLFCDLVRNSFNKKEQNKILCDGEESWPTLNKYLSNLCTGIKDLFHAEQKLIRMNSPCLIFGDIQGNFSDLLFLEKACFTSFPVIPEKLIFLGNYSGSCQYSFEVLIYLFALKLMAPNKVILLRGVNEMSIPSAKYLFYQCVDKYGTKNGKIIFTKFLDVFKTMPISAIIDENIFCSHSGIPTKNKIDAIVNLSRDLVQIQDKHTLAYELLTRHPSGTIFNNPQFNRNSSAKARNEAKEGHFKSLKSARMVTRNKMTKKDANGGSNSHGMNIRSREQSKGKLKISSSGKLSLKYKSISSKSNSYSGSGNKKKNVKAYLKRAKRALLSKSSNTASNSSAYTQTYDDEEFRAFLEKNDLTFLVRSNTQAPYGFWLKFDNRCITIYSCSTADTQGSILLIDKSNSSIRIIRFAASCKTANITKSLES